MNSSYSTEIRCTILKSRDRSNLSDKGNLDRKKGNGRPRISVERLEEFGRVLEESFILNIRSSSDTSNISRSTVHRNFTKLSLTSPIKMRKLHLVRDLYQQSRLYLAYYCQNHPYRYSDFLWKIFFTDERMFHVNGNMSTKNLLNSVKSEAFGKKSSNFALLRGCCVVRHPYWKVYRSLLDRKWNSSRWFVQIHVLDLAFSASKPLER